MQKDSKESANRTFSSLNACSVQFSRINTSKSFVIFHRFSETFPRMLLMLFFTCKENVTMHLPDIATLNADQQFIDTNAEYSRCGRNYLSAPSSRSRSVELISIWAYLASRQIYANVIPIVTSIELLFHLNDKISQ